MGEYRGLKTFKQIKDSYNELFSDSPLQESDEHYRWVLRVLSPKKGKRLLDVACGGGYLLREAEKAGIATFGIDISTVAIKLARKNATLSLLICGAGESLPFKDNFFDYITNLGSLEHFLDPKKGLIEMVRVLKKRGKAILLLPNSYFLMNILNVFRTGSTGKETKQIIDRWATRKEWMNIIEENGLRVEKVFKYNYKSKLAPLKYKLIRPFIPFNLSYSFLFECSKP